ncbi:hypothetical protein [Gordonia sputi]
MSEETDPPPSVDMFEVGHRVYETRYGWAGKVVGHGTLPIQQRPCVLVYITHSSFPDGLGIGQIFNLAPEDLVHLD